MNETAAEHKEPDPEPDLVFCGYCRAWTRNFEPDRKSETGWRCDPPSEGLVSA